MKIDFSQAFGKRIFRFACLAGAVFLVTSLFWLGAKPVAVGAISCTAGQGCSLWPPLFARFHAVVIHFAPDDHFGDCAGECCGCRR